jgi:hypothetical protein
MMPVYERTFSAGSGDTEESYMECPHQVDRKRVEQRKLIRRRAAILSLVIIFSVTTIMLVISVVHEEMKKINNEYQEVVCQETNVECFELLCPQGWKWSRKKEECQQIEGEVVSASRCDNGIITGYSCCPPEQHLCGSSPPTQCYPTDHTPHPACCAVARLGVAPSIKKMCQAGWLWVEWRNKYIRRN